MAPLNVALLVTPDFSAFHLSVPSILFSQRASGEALFSVNLCAEVPGIQHSSEGFMMDAAQGLDALTTADIVVLPFWPDPHQRPSAALIEALQAAHARGAWIAGLCLGAFVLGYAGLLDGRKASTHWEYEAAFQACFPEAQLDINALYTQDDGIITSAGTAAAIDCCLCIVRERYGSAVANRIARRMVVPPYREGGQSQFIEYPVPQSTADARINGLMEYLRQNIAAPHDLDALAARIAMSRRTLTRHFMKATGQSVTQWWVQERLRLAQNALETTRSTVEQIAAAVGFNSPITFRQHFKARFGVSPQEWRRHFQAQAARAPTAVP
ncbi:GlxA family transcriptional regulator [Zymobacter sp. IVIA_5232.4 C2]|uniref:GlxA family transcriptional regulator n=1 Tax=Zymobacter sp. IVIA_5232.4 C2 TaxID=3394855 RepID=UPI0039C018D2